MTSTQMAKAQAAQIPRAKTIDTKLEVVVIPVTDVDRAKEFYTSLGWRLDGDFHQPNWRGVQMTPPGSPASVQFGQDLRPGAPASAHTMFLVVDDIEATRAELIGKGVDVTEVWHVNEPGGPHQPGVHPEHGTYASFAAFTDPDGNSWLLQEVGARLPGRGLPLNLTTLTDLLREAETQHGEYEPSAPKHHWSGWYAAYVIARERGRTAEEAAADARLHIEGPR
jgi:catechol 2,3-dioxygenase-like lactoylglutathione lyase family enzyme